MGAHVSTNPPPFSFDLACFTYAGVHPETAFSVMREMSFAGKHGVPMQATHLSDDALISRARSRCASKFLEGTADVLVMVDRDIAWEPGAVCELAVVAREKGALVGGIYPVRGFGRLASRIEEAETIQIGGERLLRAHYLATGFLAIPRSVLLLMVEQLARPAMLDDLRIHRCLPLMDGEQPFFDFFRPIATPVDQPGIQTDLHEYLSEDYAFSLRAAALKVELLAWEKHRLIHFGQFPYRAEHGIPEPKSKIVTP